MSSVNGFRKTGVVGSGEAMLHDGDAVSRPEHVVSSKWRAVWTGTYPTLCLRGEWRVYKNDVEVAAGGLPFQGEPADTAGDYDYWGSVPTGQRNGTRITMVLGRTRGSTSTVTPSLPACLLMTAAWISTSSTRRSKRTISDLGLVAAASDRSSCGAGGLLGSQRLSLTADHSRLVMRGESPVLNEDSGLTVGLQAHDVRSP